jgi:hypothetical protein
MPGSAAWIRLALIITACAVILLIGVPASGGQPQAADDDIIPGRYIVMLKGPGSPRAVTARAGIRPRVVYEHGLWGFAGEFSDEQVRRLRADPAVLSIEPDRIVRLDDQGTTSARTRRAP